MSYLGPIRRTIILATALPALAAGSSAFALPRPASLPTPERAIPVQYHVLPRQHHRNGYHVNRYGYGNYRRGPDGSFGGYPAGSAGAQILQQQQEKKCQYVPESC